MMMKHKHLLAFNSINKRFNKYTYSFGNTDGVELRICKNGFQITAELTKIYDKNEMLSGNTYLFPDAIRKALLIYLLTNSKGLHIKSITCKNDDEEDTTVFDSNPESPIYSMIKGDLVRKLPEEFKNESVIEYLLNTPKSKYDRRIASLFAFLTSKSKTYETERFIYLWTSFNGIYSWLSTYIAEANGVDRYRKEYKQILGIQIFLSIGRETIVEGDKTRIANSVISILKNYSVSDANRSFFAQEDIAKSIEDRLQKEGGNIYNLSAYGYLLTQLSYYFRCKIVHGSKPMLLFAYADDSELHCLKILNGLLEEFIDEFLPKCFDNEYIQNTLIPKVQTITLK